MESISLEGNWKVVLSEGTEGEAHLPGTLDESGIGRKDLKAGKWHPDVDLDATSGLVSEERILTRLTRKVTYEGAASFTRTFTLSPEPGRRYFLFAERSRKLSLFWNGKEVPPYIQGTISTPYVFEVTSFLSAGENTVTLISDNSLPGWPHDPIINSSAATDETQTNWNGIIGRLELQQEDSCFISSIRAYPQRNLEYCRLELCVDCLEPLEDTLTVSSSAFVERQVRQVSLEAGRQIVVFEDVPLSAEAGRWDEDEGILHTLSVSGSRLSEKCIRFGVRSFEAVEGHFLLNGRRIFLRSESNCCVFPETGHMPMDKESWKQVLATYRSYGVNCMRFHSHCPPQAAFEAADECGMLMQCELSHWNPKSAFEDDLSNEYYELEAKSILLSYANHPSFVMLTFGNELHAGALGHERMDLLLDKVRELDGTRLYANGSNVHYGVLGADRSSDFYTSFRFYKDDIRGCYDGMTGYINQVHPGTQTSYDEAMAHIRREYGGPVFSFEVGQFEVLPCFSEIDEFRGVTIPDNLIAVREKAEAAGLSDRWDLMVEATGELSLLAYREEVEAALRTADFSGISLLGLQDFPGQGTALVGMLDSHLKSKPFPFAAPERFRSFFSPVAVLAVFRKYCWSCGEEMELEVKSANYGRKDIAEECRISLYSDESEFFSAVLPPVPCKSGTLTSCGHVSFTLPVLERPEALVLEVRIGEYSSRYTLWLYPEAEPASDSVRIARSLTEALALLEKGCDVLLDPPATAEYFPDSIAAQFTTDFWSVGTFPRQSGFMGLLLDPEHPVFRGFPTSFHSDWQWWEMCQGRSMLLPETITPLVTGLDSYAFMRHMGLLFEAKVLNGRVIVSSMGLLDRREHPEVRALLSSITAYMDSSCFSPQAVLTASGLGRIVAV